METRGIYHFSVGDLACVAIADVSYSLPRAILFANAPEEALLESLVRYDLGTDPIGTTTTCLLVDAGAETVLLDTGMGSGIEQVAPDPHPATNIRESSLPAKIHEAGYDPARVDAVVLTHGHPDHIGGLTDPNGEPVFPNARFFMDREEWRFWTSEHNLSQLPAVFGSFTRKNLPPIRRQLDPLEGDKEILAGIRILHAPGHTVGHVVVELSSHGESLLFLGDALLFPLHLESPRWVAEVDMDPEQTVATRHQLLARAAEEEIALHFYHFPFPGLGRATSEEDHWGWQAV